MPPTPDGWLPTLQAGGPPTRVLGEDDDVGDVPGMVGRRVDETTWELFVVFDPAQALQLECDRAAPDFVALHDVAGQASRRWLAEIAASRQLPVQRLVIRSRGRGVALASLPFVELPTAQGAPVRLFSTAVHADATQAAGLERVLLGSSRLALLLFEAAQTDSPPEALSRVRDGVGARTSRSRPCLLCPTGVAPAAVQAAAQALADGGVETTVTPPVARASDAIVYLAGAWNRLRLRAAAGGVKAGEIVLPVVTEKIRLELNPPHLARRAAEAPTAVPVDTPRPPSAPAPSAAEQAAASPHAPSPMAPTAGPPSPTVVTTAAPVFRASAPSPLATGAAPAATSRPMPLPMQPMPDPRAASDTGEAVPSPLQRYVQHCLEVKGMISCCVFEPGSRRVLAFAGARPGAGELAAHGAALVAATVDAARHLGLGATPPETTVTLAGHYLVVRPLHGRPALMLHAVIDRSSTPLVLAMRHLERLDELLHGG